MSIRNFRERSQQFLNANKLTTAGELFVALLIFVGGLFGVIPLSSTPVLLLFGWLMLWLRGVGWRGVGLKRPARWSHTLLLGVGVGVAYQFVSLYLIEPMLARLTGELPDVKQFAPLVGNPYVLLLSLVVTWTLAAFGEELVYRGYLMNRMADAAGRTCAGWVLSLIAVSVLFGLAHLYQGASGVIATALNGLLLGVLYLMSDHNLWAAIIAHGVADTVGFTLIFLGKYPGL